MLMLRRQVFFAKRFYGSLVEPVEIQVPVPWGNIAVKQWGDPSLPTVICCHGYLDNAGSFDKIIPLLPKRFCYWAMDYPGHGYSSAIPNGLTYTDEMYSQSTFRVIRHLGKEKVGLIGHSMGAGMNVRYLFQHVGLFSFVIAMELPVMCYNKPVERVIQAPRRLDKIITLMMRKKEEKLKTMDEILKATVIGWGGSIDIEAAEILLKRGTIAVGDKRKLSRDPLCATNQVYSISAEIPFLYQHPRQDLAFCAIEFLEGTRFYTTESLEKTLEVFSKLFRSVEYHAIRGTHHAHLRNPQPISDIITNFMDRAVPH